MNPDMALQKGWEAKWAPCVHFPFVFTSEFILLQKYQQINGYQPLYSNSLYMELSGGSLHPVRAMLVCFRHTGVEALPDLAKDRAGRAGCLVAQTAPAPHHHCGYSEKSLVGILEKPLCSCSLKLFIWNGYCFFLSSGIPQSQILLF